MIGIDLFSGAGGLSTGAVAAGIGVKLAIDSDPLCIGSYAHNHRNTDFICEDISAIRNFTKFRSRAKTILFGGPPCQGFSTSNQRTRNASNPNNWLFSEFLRAVSGIRPEWVVFENVQGLVDTERALFLDQLILGLRRRGYKTEYTILNAQDYGVPQNRSRLFVVATRTKKKITLPEKLGKKPVTVKQAIGDLPALENGDTSGELGYRKGGSSGYAKMMRSGLPSCDGHLVSRNTDYVINRYAYIPQGGNWEDIPPRLMRNYKDPTRCHTGIYRRLSWHSPSVVIGNYRKNMLIHPEQNRGLSVREAARLQSFPDHYSFQGPLNDQQQQVGNAVPPLLAQALFESILN